MTLSGGLDESHEAYLAGRTKMARGEYESAAALFEKSNAAFPHFKTLELLGECRLMLHDPKAALIPLAASMGLSSNGFRAAYLLATAFLALDITRNAYDYAERALIMKPDYRKARELKERLEALGIRPRE